MKYRIRIIKLYRIKYNFSEFQFIYASFLFAAKINLKIKYKRVLLLYFYFKEAE